MLLNLPLKDLIESCRLTKNSNAVCNSKYFLTEYADKNYYLDLPDDLSIPELKNIISKADFVTKLLKPNRLITYDAYIYLIKNMKKANIEEFFNPGSGYSIVILNLASFVTSKGLEPKFKNEDFLGKTKEEILEELKRPTLYVTEKGLIILPYNPDFDYITLEHFMAKDQVNDIINSRRKLYYETYNLYKSL